MENNRSRIQAWLEAARPKTLPASFSPVLVGCALAYRDGVFKLAPAILCVLVALLAQIASNFANDYFDFKKGADKEDRLGPERAVASGWITPKAMLWGTFITLGLSCLCGCFLFFFAGWELIGVGIAIAICVLAYSAGPFPLAYNGLGDVCVMDQISDKKNREENWVEQLSLSEAMKRLPVRERRIIDMRFFEGKTQTEVAGEVGISQAQVSRLEKNALKAMKSYLD